MGHRKHGKHRKRCDKCGKRRPKGSLTKVRIHDRKRRLCPSCLDKRQRRLASRRGAETHEPEAEALPAAEVIEAEAEPVVEAEAEPVVEAPRPAIKALPWISPSTHLALAGATGMGAWPVGSPLRASPPVAAPSTAQPPVEPVDALPGEPVDALPDEPPVDEPVAHELGEPVPLEVVSTERPATPPRRRGRLLLLVVLILLVLLLVVVLTAVLVAVFQGISWAGTIDEDVHQTLQ